MAVLLLLFIVLVFLLSIPAFQTKLGKHATNSLNEEYGTHINIDKIGLRFNGDVDIKNIYIEDYKKDTLINVKALNTSILNFKNIYKGALEFGDINITGLRLNIKTYKGSRDTNLDVFVDKFESDNPEKSKSKFLLSSNNVSINKGLFTLSDENKETTKILHFSDLDIAAKNLLINGSNVNVKINALAFKDSRGLMVKNMMTDFEYTPKSMTFSNLDIKTPRSVLKGVLNFSYKREDLKYFTDKVLVSASFKDSNIALNDLNVFYNEFGINQRAKFNVDLSGTLNNLKAKKLKLRTSSNTTVFGNIKFKNLFNQKKGKFLMNGSFTNLSSTYKDLKALLPNVLGAAIPSMFSRLGMFTIRGNSQVTASEVNADIQIFTSLGFIESNLEIAKINDIDNAAYKGNVVFEEFDLGTFLNDSKIGKVSLDLDVNGKGFLAKNVNTQVKGDVFEIFYNKYDYKGIKVAGSVQDKIFNGNLVVDDKNLKLNFSGLIDYSEKIKKYDFNSNIEYANLKELKLLNKDEISVFKSNVKMNVKSSNYDDAFGNISFKNTTYTNEHATYKFNRFDASSHFKDGVRFIEFNSPDIIEGDLNGRFKFKELKNLFENSIGYMYSNYEPNEVEANQVVDFNFKIYSKIVEVFYPDIELAKNTYVRGAVESDEKKFKLTFKSPKIQTQEYFAKNIELQVDNNNPLFNTYIELDSLDTKYYNISKFNLINVTVNDTLFMRSEFKGGKNSNDIYNLSFYHSLNEDHESVLGFKKSDITIKNNKWFINNKQDKFNKVSFNKALTKFNLNKFKITHNNEEVNLSGTLKDSTQKDIELNFKNVDLAKIIPDIDSLEFSGNVNGKLNMLQKNGNYLPSSSITIDNLKLNKFPLGNFDALIKGNKTLTNYNVDISLKDDVKESLIAKGDVFIKGKQSKIELDLTLKDLSLAPLNPLLQDALSNIRGLVSGKSKIIGDINKPSINGDLNLNQSGFSIPYLNVDYSLKDNASVSLKDQSFVFNKIELSDSKHESKGEINGVISHVNLSKWQLDLDLETKRLLILDTQESEDALYYGTGFLGGVANISGPAQELDINVIGETEKGTVFKIPLSDAESFGDSSFIHFITKEEKEARKKGKEIKFKEIKGLELDFDLDLTEDAEVEIIIDKNTGHALKGRGRGGLLVEINTNGKFNMWGDFSVFEGVYNFAYGGLIQKEFIVQPGGTIAWEGDPLEAQLNMQAIYKTQANPSSLLDTPTNRSIPVELNINLNGDLEQPNPEFSFDFPNVNSTIKSKLQYSLESEEDRQNQALYLISTGSFSRGLDELNFSGTIAERLNGIIGGLFNSDNGKFNVNPYFEAGENNTDYQTDNRVGVTLKTQLSDRVLINSKVAVPVGGVGTTVVAGDVEIDFLLNKEGTLTAKAFNRENSIRNFGEAIGYTQGIGLSYNVDFDTFKELIQKIIKKYRKEEDENAPKKINKNDDGKTLPEFISVKSSKK